MGEAWAPPCSVSQMSLLTFSSPCGGAYHPAARCAARYACSRLQRRRESSCKFARPAALRQLLYISGSVTSGQRILHTGIRSLEFGMLFAYQSLRTVTFLTDVRSTSSGSTAAAREPLEGD